MRFDLLAKIVLILNDAGDDQPHSAQPCNLDRQMNTFVRMDSAEENDVIAAVFLKWIQREVDTVVDSCQVIQSCRPVRVADRDEVSVSILLIDRHYFCGRKSVDSCQYRCSD